MSDQERWEKEKKERQSILKHDMAEEIEGREVTDAEAEHIICKELKDEDDHEYLVNGAVLSCTSAVWDDFPLSGNEGVHIEGAEKKTKDNKPTGILSVWENPLYTDNLHHATVADAKQGHNILPFFGNCKEPALPEQKTEIRNNIADCQKNGVCKYLMDLEEEWENIDFSRSMYLSKEEITSLSYEDFEDKDATMSIGVGKVGSLGDGVRTDGKKQGIMMTSVLFCRHGGFIYPVTSGQGLLMLMNKDRHSLTDDELRKLGFLFQRGDKWRRTEIFNFLFPMLYLDGSSYGETVLKKHFQILNDEKIPAAAERYVEALNKLEINDKNYNVEQMIGLLSWDQQKIVKTFDACREYSLETGIIISPYLAVAIIGVEGTGSYDTNAKVKSEYGVGYGSQHDFELDTENGLNLVNEKLGGYIVYGDEYKNVAQNAGREEYLIHYIWENTPKLGRNFAAPYATGIKWPSYVEEKYQFYSKEEREDERDYIHDYEMLLMGYDKELMENKDTVQYEFVYENGIITAKTKNTN